MPALSKKVPLSIPDSYAALELRSYEGSSPELHATEKSRPALGPEEVLIRMEASPINPSDLMFLHGRYGVVKPLPTVPGFEGCGRVVACGESFLARHLLGVRVACTAMHDGDGTWAEYLKTAAVQCFRIPETWSVGKASTFIVNPFTAHALVHMAIAAGVKAIVQTAAASQVGKGVSKLAHENGLKTIEIVRRESHAKELLERGADVALVNGMGDFEELLKNACLKLDARMAFDAVGSTLAGVILDSMPPNSKLISYGALADETIYAKASNLIFQNKSLEGFWLSRYLPGLSDKERIRTGVHVKHFVNSLGEPAIQAEFPFREVSRAMRKYVFSMSSGKVLLRFN